MSKAVEAVGKVFSAVFKPITKFLAPSIDKPKVSDDTGNTTQTIRSGKEAAHFIYGRTATGGVLAWAQEEPGDDTKDEQLHMVYVLAEGEIDALEQVYVNQEPAGSFGSLISYELHVNRTTPDPFMLEHCPDWRQEQIGRGISYVRVSLTFDQDKFATGIPDLLFVVRGNRNIYDPRTQATGYSDNAVLCTLDYVRNRLGVSDDKILWDSWIEAANIASEAVTDPDGNTQKRYAIGGVYKADARKDETLADLEATFAGTCRRIGGHWGCQVGAYYGPATLTLTEDMVIGTVSGRTEVSRADAINTITGKFNSPDDLWQETSYPTVAVDEWVTEDGGENSKSVDFPFSPNSYQCQRLANIELRRKRVGGNLKLTMNHNGYLFRPGKVVNVDLPSINVSGEFAVTDWKFSAKNGIEVTIRQEDADIYDDAIGEPFDALPFISLPAGGIGSPTGLQYITETIGEVVQGRLTWNPVNGALDYSVIIKRGTDAVLAIKTPSGATTAVVSGLTAGSYVAEVYARGNTRTSGASSITFTINLPPVPDRVITTIGNREVTLIPVLPAGTDLGGGTFRYYVTQSESAAQTDAEYIGQGLSFTHTGLTPLTTYYYWVQSVNAYGASGFLRVEVTTSLKFDEEFNYIEQQIEAGGTLYDTIVNAATPAAVQAAEDAVAPFQEQLDANTTAIGEFQYADEAQSIKLLMIKAADQTNRAVLNVEQTVRADIAQQVTTLQAGQAEVEDRLYAVVNEDGSFTAGAVRTVEVGDSKAILGLYTNGEVSEIGGIADRFYIYNEVSGEMVLAFVVQDGRVVMPESLIGSVTIGKLVTDTGETLIEGGKIKTKFIDVDAISAKELVSKVNGFNGRPTFALRENGSFEFNSTTSGNGGMKWDGATQIVTDDNGTTRIKIGRLS